MNDQTAIFDVSADDFQTSVVEQSRQRPVLLLFWAAQVPPSAAARDSLATLLPAYQDKVALGLVDVSKDPTLAQHLRVQGLPSLRVISDGQIVSEIDGPQTDAVYRELLDQLTMSSSDALKAGLAQCIQSGDFSTALNMLRQAIAEEPNNQAFRVELADVLVLQQELEEARTVLAQIPEDTAERERPQNRLEIAEEAAGLPELADLRAALDAGDDKQDALDLRYQLAVRLAAAGEFEPALEHAMEVLRTDRTYRDDIGRLTMIRIFAVLGKGSELASRYRRQMFNYMH